MLSACGSKGALYLPVDPEPVVSNVTNVKSDTESDAQAPAPEDLKDPVYALPWCEAHHGRLHWQSRSDH